MTFDFPVTVFNGVTLICAITRVGSFIFAFTFLDQNEIPPMFKILLTLGISVLVFPTLPPVWLAPAVSGEVNVFLLTMILAMEFVLGLCLALIVRTLLTIVEVAGQQFGENMGFSMATEIDPASGIDTPVLTIIFTQVLVIVFFALDFHHDVVRLAALSFQMIGPGQFVLENSIGENLIALGGQAIKQGFHLALPIFALMALVNLSLGFMARLGEDFPVMMLAFPVRIGLGFLVLIAMVPVLVYYCRTLAENIVDWFAFIVT